MSLPTIWKYIDKVAFNRSFKRKYAKEKLREATCRSCAWFHPFNHEAGVFSGVCDCDGVDYVVISFKTYPDSGQRCWYYLNKNMIKKLLVPFPTN